MGLGLFRNVCARSFHEIAFGVGCLLDDVKEGVVDNGLEEAARVVVEEESLASVLCLIAHIELANVSVVSGLQSRSVGNGLAT